MATVPVFTHCPNFAVWTSANFFANATACLPGKGCPPHLELVSTSSSAAFSSSVARGHSVKGLCRNRSPPLIANLLTCANLLERILLDAAYRPCLPSQPQP